MPCGEDVEAYTGAFTGMQEKKLFFLKPECHLVKKREQDGTDLKSGVNDNF